MAKRNYSWMAIISFVLGIFLFIWVLLYPSLQYYKSVFLFVGAILSIVLGFIGLNQIKKDKKLTGKLFAWLGIILGFLSIIYSFYFKFSRIF